MSERLLIKRIIAPLAVATLGLTACSAESSTASPRKEDVTREVDNSEDFQATTSYTPSGKRITSFEGDGYSFRHIYSFCDAYDLIDMQYGYDNAPGIARSANHPACSDGRLTPTDFAILK